MNNHKTLIESFYRAFQQKDYKTMAECYHPEAYFKDEAFELTGKEIGAMWHMLCERGKDMTMAFSVQDQSGKITAHWEPKYSFSQTGRFVHNIIDAEFEFKDGKIIRHIDQFNFWRWSRQALGLPGVALGWSSFLQNKVSSMAMSNLKKFVTKHPEYRDE
ncbi:nuclear transport factor 2 family protein [Litoribacillus peritrichatus]|uniref:Nuclear transport factor 2 family protein n=1 Tax=Litoribacillus peritrichatus TaxID=718191 RepID=A0ABP7MRA3_9GAMM